MAGGHYPQWGAIIQACTIHTLSSSQVSLQQNKKEERDTFQDMACVCVLLPNGGRGVIFNPKYDLADDFSVFLGYFRIFEREKI